MIQYHAAFAITGVWQGSNCLKIHEKLGKLGNWETLSDRRLSKRILQIHKIIDGKSPSYLKNKLPPNRLPFLSNVFRDTKCRTDRYKSSFVPDAIASWSECITRYEHLHTRDGLEKHLHSFFRPKAKSIFSLYDPGGLRILFQLRLGLSSQRSHNENLR